VKQIHEFWVTDDTEEAVRKTKITMKRVGELTRVIPGEHIEGTVAFGVQPVRVHITWRTETRQEALEAADQRKTEGEKPVPVGVAAAGDTTGDGAVQEPRPAPVEPKPNAANSRYASVGGGMGTSIVLEVDAQNHAGNAQRSAIERFEDAYMHFDRPDYAPDRLGVLPITIIGIVVAFVLLIVFILLYPRLNRKPTNTDAGTSASAVIQRQFENPFSNRRVVLS
jgi:hypothetical protein